MREKILKAITSSSKAGGHKFEPVESFKKKQIENALNRIVKSRFVLESNIVAMMDTTLFGSCKEGYVITTAAFYSYKTDDVIRLNDIVKAEKSIRTTYDSIITLKSGEKITLFTSAYRDYINEILNKIAKANGAKEEPEDAAAEKPAPKPAPKPAAEKAAAEKPAAEKAAAEKVAAEKAAAEKVAAEKAAAEKVAAEKAAAEKAEQDRIQDERIQTIIKDLQEKIRKARDAAAQPAAEEKPATEKKPVTAEKPKSAMFTFDDEENDLYIEELEKALAEDNKRIKAQAQRRTEEKKFAEQMSEEDREYKNALESLNAYRIKSDFPGPGDEQMNPLCTKDENEIKRLQEAEELFLSGELMMAETIFRDVAYAKSNPYAYFMLAKVLMKYEEEEHNEKKKKALVKEIEDCLGISAHRGYYPAVKCALTWYKTKYNTEKLIRENCVSDEVYRLLASLIYDGDNKALKEYLDYYIEFEYVEYDLDQITPKDAENIFIIAKYRAKHYRDDDAANTLEQCYNFGFGTEIDYGKASQAIFFEID